MPANPTQTNNIENEHYTEHAGGAQARPLPVVVKKGRGDLADRALEIYNGFATKNGLATCGELTAKRRNWLNKRVEDIGGLKKFELALSETPFDDWLMGRLSHNEKLFQLTLDRLLYTGGDAGDRLANLLDRAMERARAKPRAVHSADRPFDA